MNIRLLAVALIATFGAIIHLSVGADGESVWIATYFWSPQYCNEDLASREPQCVQPHGFVFRSLIRTRNGSALENCDNEESISRNVLERLMSVTLNWRRTKAVWDRYGKCSGYSASEYAGLIEYIDRRIVWPSSYEPQNAYANVKVMDIAQQISAANHGLDYQTMSFKCSGPWLEQIQLCLNSNFGYSAGACPSSNTCGGDVKLHPFQARPD